MLQFINGIGGLIIEILSFTATAIGLIAAFYGKLPDKWKKKWNILLYFLVLTILFLVGIGIFLARATYKPPTPPMVAILSPSSSIEATKEGKSVWFPVSGTSSGVISDYSLLIYVLVFSEPDWHVQRSAIVEADGRWFLNKAWIGGESDQIKEGDQIKLMAVVSRGKFNPDDKFIDYRHLNPVAVSEIVSARVALVKGQ